MLRMSTAIHQLPCMPPQHVYCSPLFIVYAFILDTHPTPLIFWHFTSNTHPTHYFNPVMVHQINWLHPIHDRLFCILSSHTTEAAFFSSSDICVKIIPSLAQFFTQQHTTRCRDNYRMSPYHLIWLFILANLTTCHVLYATTINLIKWLLTTKWVDWPPTNGIQFNLWDFVLEHKNCKLQKHFTELQKVYGCVTCTTKVSWQEHWNLFILHCYNWSETTLNVLHHNKRVKNTLNIMT